MCWVWRWLETSEFRRIVTQSAVAVQAPSATKLAILILGPPLTDGLVEIPTELRKVAELVTEPVQTDDKVIVISAQLVRHSMSLLEKDFDYVERGSPII